MRLTATPIVVASLFLAGCSGFRPETPLDCALIGGTTGVIGGAAVGANVENDDEAENAGIGAAVGAVVGALAGYAICAMMPEGAPQPAAAPAAPKQHVVRKTVVLPGVNFAFNRADLTLGAKETLDSEVVSELSANPSLTVLIQGHTDSVGSES